MVEFDPSRRQILKGAGVTAVGLTGAGVILTGGAGTAAASATGTIGNAEVTSNAGRVKNVLIDTTGRMTFDGLDTPAEQFRVRVYLSAVDSGGNTVVSETLIHDDGQTDFPSNPDDWGGAGEAADGGREGYIASDAHWYVVQQDGQAPGPEEHPLPSNPVDNEPFTVDTDGESETYFIRIRSRYDLYDGNGNALTGNNTNLGVVDATGEVELTVNNEAATTSFGNKDAQDEGADSASANAPPQE